LYQLLWAASWQVYIFSFAASRIWYTFLMLPRLMKLFLNPRFQALLLNPKRMIALLVVPPLLSLIVIGVILRLLTGSWWITIAVPLVLMGAGIIGGILLKRKLKRKAQEQMANMQAMMGQMAQMFTPQSPPPSVDPSQLKAMMGMLHPQGDKPLQDPPREPKGDQSQDPKGP
jgi:hypothetical protein